MITQIRTGGTSIKHSHMPTTRKAVMVGPGSDLVLFFCLAFLLVLLPYHHLLTSCSMPNASVSNRSFSSLACLSAATWLEYARCCDRVFTSRIWLCCLRPHVMGTPSQVITHNCRISNTRYSPSGHSRLANIRFICWYLSG